MDSRNYRKNKIGGYALQHLREFITKSLTLKSDDYNKIYRNKANKKDNKVNEKIIIDGIDVSGCKHIMTEGFDFAQCKDEIRQGSFSQTCHQHINCYYKQLKRAELENERLKSIIESNKQEVEQALMDNDRLQKEIQALRRQFY